VRADVNAVRGVESGAEIASCGLLLDRSERISGAVGSFYPKIVHFYGTIGTLIDATIAADAPILDDDLPRVLTPNRAHRTAHHTQRVIARSACAGDQIVVEARPYSREPTHSVVTLSTRIDTGITSSAGIQVDDQKVFRQHQPIVHELT